MLTKPIFETLPIGIIALSLLLMALVHHPIAIVAGTGLIIASCLMLYRHYTEAGTAADPLDDGRMT